MPGKRAIPVRPAAPVAVNPAVSGRDAMLVIDAETGRELEGFAAADLRHPASLTKIMTLYMAFAALDSGRLRLADRLPVSARAGAVQPSKMDAPVGGTLVVRDAIMGLVTRSANDAAVVLAEGISGDEASFAQAMTQTARRLGMASSTFRNASGLPDTHQVTTARDLARLAQALLRDFPHYYPIFSQQAWHYAGRTLTNHNRMLGSYAGADGIKTGYIRASGFNLVMSATRDNRRLIGVVFGGESPGERDSVMADMMDRGFDRAAAQRLPAWRRPSAPASARYTAAHFAPGSALPAEQAVAAQTAPAAGVPRLVSAYEAESAQGGSADGPVATPRGGARWAIQIGSYRDQKSANAALARAIGQLPELKGSARPTVDPVTSQGRKVYRARLADLDERRATTGCKKLEGKRINCAAVEIAAP
ncbi:MAG: D-alanyl-D-alanine carboxypeptidase [Rhodospirillales bacterium]|nr:MAG: D-alanyl-D-alanine carboxypeptidase [Rhodospirillales bacterium]